MNETEVTAVLGWDDCRKLTPELQVALDNVEKRAADAGFSAGRVVRIAVLNYEPHWGEIYALPRKNS